MKPWIKYAGVVAVTIFTVATPIVLSTPFDTAKKNGESYVTALIATTKRFADAAGGLAGSPWIFIPALLFVGGGATFYVMKTFNKYNAGQKWWVGLQRLSIRRAACALANNLPESEFDSSPHARALAEDILSLVNHGHMPLADERPSLANIGAALSAASQTGPNNIGPYGKKDRTVNALVLISTLNAFARERKLALPWPIPTAEPAKN